MSKRASLLDRRALFANAAAAAVLAASGVSAQSRPQRGGRLHLAVSGASRRDSWISGGGLFMRMARQGLVFDTLTEVAADGTLQGELAIGWRSTKAGQNWSFDLRRGVRFHDGAAFTAKDVVASLSLPMFASVTAPSTHRVEITLPSPNVNLPLLLSKPDYVIRAAHAPSAGIGTGLYQVKDFHPGRRLLTKRVAQHYKDDRAGWFDTVELTAIQSEEVRRQALKEALVDGVDLKAVIDPDDLINATMFRDDTGSVQALVSHLSYPAVMGKRYPFDDMRAAERWWFS
ncbi:MAG: ABC transporter substrate-binding protein [Pseudomonadota bacterium]